jgi:hypothetical protein
MIIYRGPGISYVVQEPVEQDRVVAEAALAPAPDPPVTTKLVLLTTRSSSVASHFSHFGSTMSDAWVVRNSKQ